MHTDYEVDPFRTVPISDIMTTPVVTLPACATVGDARTGSREVATARIRSSTVMARCVGIVSRNDLLLVDDDADGKPVVEYGSEDVVSVQPEDLAVTALQRMLEEQVEHLPGPRGRMSRRDVYSYRPAPNSCEQFELEEHQVGWRLLPFKRRMAG